MSNSQTDRGRRPAAPSLREQIAQHFSGLAAWCSNVREGLVCFDHTPDDISSWCDCCVLQRAATLLLAPVEARSPTPAPRSLRDTLVALQLVLKNADRACDADNVDTASDYIGEALRHVAVALASAPGDDAQAATPEIRCRYCGEEIRWLDGKWLNRETWSICAEGGPNSNQPHDPPRVESVEAPPPTWQPIATAPKVHPLHGGDDLLLYWNAPGINEPIFVVGQWRDGWWSGANRAYPTHWMHIPAEPLLSPTADPPKDPA